MRRAATWLVVGAVFALAGVAVVEAFLRDEEQPPEARTPTRAPSSTAAEDDLSGRLAEAGVAGLLYLAGRDEEGCELWIVRLPSAVLESGFRIPSCRFAVSPEGVIATGSECSGTQLGALWTATGVLLEQFAGCAPAWKPSGELTFVRAGNVMAASRACADSIDECARIVLPAREIRRGLTTRPGDPPSRLFVRELAWLDDSRLGVLFRRIVGLGIGDASGDYFDIFQGRRSLGLERGDPTFWADLTVDRPRRRFYLSDGEGLFELDDRGRFVGELALPSEVAPARSVALSPDGTWVAAANRARVILSQPGDPPEPTFPLPFEAEELEWRGP